MKKTKEELETEVADFEREMERKMEEKEKELFEEEASRLGSSPDQIGEMMLPWVDERSALPKVPSRTRR